MEDKELRRIIREEIRNALSEFFAQQRISDMEESFQRERSSGPWPKRMDYQVDRLSFFTDRLASTVMRLEDWGDECECSYSETDIKHIKDKVDKL